MKILLSVNVWIEVESRKELNEFIDMCQASSWDTVCDEIRKKETNVRSIDFVRVESES